MTTMDRDRALGLVAGFLCGDALGAPFLAVKAGHIQQLAGDRVDAYLANPVIFPERPDKNTLPGVHTIAGQMFLALLAAAGTEETGQHPLARAATNLRELAGETEFQHATLGALRAPGRPLRRALERWAMDYPWEPEDHFAPDEPSRGAATAALAMAAVLRPEVDPLDAARMTHLREDALVAAVVIHGAARYLAAEENPKKLNPRHAADHLIALARETEDALRAGDVGETWRSLEWGVPPVRFSECLSPLASLLETGDDALAEKTLVKQALEFSPDNAVSHPQHGFAAALVPWVLYRALGPMPPARAVEDAINRGGETPMAAALVGALTGARHGIGSIPGEWTDGLRAWEIARGLADGSSLSVEEAWQQAEAGWTGEQERMRAPLRESVEARKAAQPVRKKPKPADPDPAMVEQGKLPFAPPPQVWLEQHADELAPWEKQRLKSERGRKRIDWKETRRAKDREVEPGGSDEDSP